MEIFSRIAVFVSLPILSFIARNLVVICRSWTIMQRTFTAFEVFWVLRMRCGPMRCSSSFLKFWKQTENHSQLTHSKRKLFARLGTFLCYFFPICTKNNNHHHLFQDALFVALHWHSLIFMAATQKLLRHATQTSRREQSSQMTKLSTEVS